MRLRSSTTRMRLRSSTTRIGLGNRKMGSGVIFRGQCERFSIGSARWRHTESDPENDTRLLFEEEQHANAIVRRFDDRPRRDVDGGSGAWWRWTARRRARRPRRTSDDADDYRIS